MSTPNFNYYNRCIVVTNDDYDCGNYPKQGEYNKQSLRSYPSVKLADYEDEFNYFDVVMTSGYYEDACIDFVEKEDPKNVEYYCGQGDYFTNKGEFFKEIKYYFNHITQYKMRQLCKGLTMENDWETIYEKLDKYLMDMEREKVNKALNGIRDLYGYEELSCIGVASNGEGLYSKIG